MAQHLANDRPLDAKPGGPPWEDILDFERTQAQMGGAKAVAVRNRFGMSLTRYYQLLNRTLDRPEALEYDPMLVHRLRRRRETRRRTRFARMLGLE